MMVKAMSNSKITENLQKVIQSSPQKPKAKEVSSKITISLCALNLVLLIVFAAWVIIENINFQKQLNAVGSVTELKQNLTFYEKTNNDNLLKLQESLDKNADTSSQKFKDINRKFQSLSERISTSEASINAMQSEHSSFKAQLNTFKKKAQVRKPKKAIPKKKKVTRKAEVIKPTIDIHLHLIDIWAGKYHAIVTNKNDEVITLMKGDFINGWYLSQLNADSATFLKGNSKVTLQPEE